MTQSHFSTIEDFVFDRSFRNWVLQPENDESEWNAFEAANFGLTPIINHAKAIVYALQINEKLLTEAEINNEISRLLAKINNQSFDGDLSYEYKPVNSIFTNRPLWLKIAAMLVLIAGSCYFLFNQKTLEPIDSYASFSKAQKQKPVEVNNSTDKGQLIILPDSSTILLAPKSKIIYASLFVNDKREVYLVGEAFFTVSKDPAHPFFVYSNDIVTKVLGTSFRIKAQSGNKASIVMVRTGKVSVFKKENFTNADKKPGELGGTIVLPNQQVTYNSESGNLIKSLVQEPVILTETGSAEFVFNATPMKQVFEKLESVYGIRIVTDDEAISGCTFSATLGKETFYQKLDLICKSLNATYEVVDGDIVISSVGCK